MVAQFMRYDVHQNFKDLLLLNPILFHICQVNNQGNLERKQYECFAWVT